MALKMFDSLLPYFGGKRKLCPIIFGQIDKYLTREKWLDSVFVDGFLGSGAVSLYAKAQGFQVIANDISERSVLAGRALIENNDTFLTDDDLYKLCLENIEDNQHLIVTKFMPDVFSKRHAIILDNAFANAKTPLEKYLLLKYIFHIRPYSKFSSPNAFNRPLEEGRYDQIKSTYTKHLKDNFKSPLEILKVEKKRINAGIFSNGKKNQIYKMDIVDFIAGVKGSVLYLDPPYSGTLSYESEYGVLDEILGDKKSKSRFSENDGMDMLGALLAKAEHFSLWVISFGNAGGKNDLNKLVEMVSKYRKCEAKEFSYKHCESMASEEHKQNCREWLVIAWK